MTSVVPLRVHIYTNGYVLLCSSDYKAGPDHYEDRAMQFSNAARASLEPGYTVEKPPKRAGIDVEVDSAAGMEIVGTGQRRTVAWLSQHASAVGVDFNTVWARMRMAVVHAVLAAEGPLAEGWGKIESGGMASSAQRFILPKVLGVKFTSQPAHALYVALRIL